MIDSSLISVLACPACQSKVIQDDGCIVCINEECALKYPIINGVAMMLVKEAVKK